MAKNTNQNGESTQGIQLKMFDSNFCKFLETKTFKYNNKNSFNKLNNPQP